jgi:hypothetical protein
MNGVREPARLLQIWFRGLAPDQVGKRRVRQAARNGRIQAAANTEEALGSPLTGNKCVIAWIDVTREQMSAVGIGARHDQRRYAHHVGRQTSSHQLLDRFGSRYENLAAEMSALLCGGKLVFEVNASGARLDHGFHEFKGVQGAAKARFRVGHDRSEPIRGILTVHVVDLVGSHERVVDLAHHVRNAVGRVKALVGIHLASPVGVGCDLPAAEVDRLQSGLHLLDRLVARESAQRGHVRFTMEKRPEALRAEPRQSVFDVDRAPKLEHVVATVGALYALPARFGLPLFFKFRCV